MGKIQWAERTVQCINLNNMAGKLNISPVVFLIWITASDSSLAKINYHHQWSRSREAIKRSRVRNLCLLNWPLPTRAFRANEISHWNKLKKLRIPTGRRQISWLCTSAAAELNQALPGTNSAGGHGGTWMRDLPKHIRRPNHSATLTPPERILEPQWQGFLFWR